MKCSSSAGGDQGIADAPHTGDSCSSFAFGCAYNGDSDIKKRNLELLGNMKMQELEYLEVWICRASKGRGRWLIETLWNGMV